MAARRRASPSAPAGALPRPRRRESSRLLPSAVSVAIGLALLATAAVAYAVARETSLFALREVTVEGAPPRVARAVEQALEPLVGASLLTVDAAAVSERLDAVPWVAAASFDRAFPHGLVVTVTPERPVAVLRSGAHAWLLSARGRVLERQARRTHPGLPRIWAGPGADPGVGEVLRDSPGGRAARSLAPLHWVRFPARVASVSVADGQLTFVLRSGLQLRLGDTTDLRLKLAVAERVLRRIGPAGAGNYLDVSVPERPVVFLNPQVGG